MIFGFVDEGILERGNTLGDNDGESKSLGERGDVAQSHDTGETSVSAALGDVVDHCGHSTSVHDELCQFNRQQAIGDKFTNTIKQNSISQMTK